MQSKKTDLIYILVLIVLTFSVSINTLQNGFVYDDNITIVDNYLLKNPNNFYMLFSKDYYGYSKEITFRPLITLNYYFDYLLFKLNPMWYHLENVIWHILVVITLYFLAKKIPGYSRNCAFFTALLFGVLTIHTEVINITSYREDILMTFFLLLSFVTYLKLKMIPVSQSPNFVEAGFVPANNNPLTPVETQCIASLQRGRVTTRPAPTLFILSLIFYFFSLMSKETAIIFLPLLFLYDFLFEGIHTPNPSQEGNSKKISWKYYIGYFIITVIFFILNFIVMKNPLLLESGFIGNTFSERFLTGINIIGKYLFLLIAPFRLAIDHLITLKRSFIDIEVLLAISVILLLIIFAILFWKTKPIISFSILFFFIGILPVSNIIVLQNPVGERYLYLPTIGFCLLISYLLFNARFKKINVGTEQCSVPTLKIGVCLLILLIIYYSILTIYQNRFYKDGYTVWKRVVELYPDSSKGYMNLGFQLTQQGKFDVASEEFSKAITLESRNYLAYIGLGEIYMKYGRFIEALEVIKKGVKIEPRYYSGYNSLGNIYYNLTLYNQAEESFKEALRINPYFADAYNNLGNVYFEQGRMKEAMESYKKAINLNPQFAEAYNNLGNLLLQTGRVNEAEVEFRKALIYKPELIQARHNLATVYMNQQGWNEAVRELEVVVKSSDTIQGEIKTFPIYISHYYLGIAYDNLKEYQKAIQELEIAIKLNPDDVEVRNYLYSVKKKN